IANDTFSHTGAGGSTPTDRMVAAGYQLTGSWTTGENLAWQSLRGAAGIQDDVADLHVGLMNSPGHRANILNGNFREVGIGIETG
ncbi:CAP domain-containing protein, partial [Acinetobacter baumannii]|uniref:CAP domain-containing protein n=1 Tax=Acinetobacter baumannii TaxID=470 RepID=UPI00332CA54E